FSSRRRHTSFSRDWSSDVCSSDLALPRRISRLARGGGVGDAALLDHDRLESVAGHVVEFLAEFFIGCLIGCLAGCVAGCAVGDGIGRAAGRRGGEDTLGGVGVATE